MPGTDAWRERQKKKAKKEIRQILFEEKIIEQNADRFSVKKGYRYFKFQPSSVEVNSLLISNRRGKHQTVETVQALKISKGSARKWPDKLT